MSSDPERTGTGGERRLIRSRDRMLGGVAGGVAEYFGIDRTLTRVLLVVLFFLGAGWVLPVYLVLWLIMPEAGGAITDRSRSGVALVFGIILIVLGGMLFLLMLGVGWIIALPGPMFPVMAILMLSWPVLLIVAGLLVIVLLGRRER